MDVWYENPKEDYLMIRKEGYCCTTVSSPVLICCTIITAIRISFTIEVHNNGDVIVVATIIPPSIFFICVVVRLMRSDLFYNKE